MLSDVDEVKGDRAAYHQSLRQWWDGRTCETEWKKKTSEITISGEPDKTK